MKSESTAILAEAIPCEGCFGQGYFIQPTNRDGYDLDDVEDCVECKGVGFARCVYCGQRSEEVCVQGVEGACCRACMAREGEE